MAKLITKNNAQIIFGVICLVLLIAIVCTIVCNKDEIAEQFGRRKFCASYRYEGKSRKKCFRNEKEMQKFMASFKS
jgi:hypothetical protein